MAIGTDRRKKTLAVLAAGAVLGVGAAITLAAWNDSEFATGTFQAGAFNLEGSTTDGTTDAAFADHASSDPGVPASLSFSLGDDAEALAPGDVVASPFWVRLDAETTVGGELTAVGVTTDGGANDEFLSYEVYLLAHDDVCSVAADAVDGAVLFASGETLDDFTAGSSATLAPGSGAAAGESVQLCFVVSADADLEQKVSATATWQFEAVSH